LSYVSISQTYAETAVRKYRERQKASFGFRVKELRFIKNAGMNYRCPIRSLELRTIQINEIIFFSTQLGS